jgi:hypothetical protein
MGGWGQEDGWRDDDESSGRLARRLRTEPTVGSRFTNMEEQWQHRRNQPILQVKQTPQKDKNTLIRPKLTKIQPLHTNPGT